MKKGMIAFIIVLLTAALAWQIPGTVSGSNTGTDSGITFTEGTWEDVLRQAKAENKYIFVDFSVSWCGHCKRMRSNVFPAPNVGAFYNSSFINVTLDAEKGEGKGLAAKYKVKGYPTFVFFSPDGNVVHQIAGYRNASQFIALGKEVLNK